MNTAPSGPTAFLWLGGHPCLDFVNTEYVGERGQPIDLLADFLSLLEWLERAELLPKAAARRARRWKGARAGGEALERARSLRAELRSLVQRVASGRPASQGTLDAVNRLLRAGKAYLQLVRTRKGYAKEWRRQFDRPADLLLPLAEAAANLLCSADLSLIKRCENPNCVLCFYDTSKNRARRWCSMAVCGNRMKATAHYRRSRARAAALTKAETESRTAGTAPGH